MLFQPHSSRAAGTWTPTAQQAGPRKPGKDSEGHVGATGAVLETSVCKVQAAGAGAAGNILWVGPQSGMGQDLRSWFPGGGRQRILQNTGSNS